MTDTTQGSATTRPANGAQPGRQYRVYIVDDHPIVRLGLRQMLEQEVDLTVCGEAGDAYVALADIPALKPDVVLVDISIESVNGIELTKAIRLFDQELPILVLSMHDETLYAERALRAGANGYIMKQEAADRVVRALRSVLRGELYVSENISSRMLRDFLDGNRARQRSRSDGVETLSDRELEIFELVGRGKSARDIADMLGLSVKTVETHRGHIKTKLKLRNASELIHHAVNWVQAERIH